MKKILCILIAATFLLSGLPKSFTVKAGSLNTELLTNTGFESADMSMWSNSGCTITRESTVKNSGSYGVKITNRYSAATSVQQNITQILLNNGQGRYDFSTYIQMAEGVATTQMLVVISIECTGEAKKWYTGNAYITNSALTKVTGANKLITWTGTLTRALIYVQNSDTTKTDLYLDDFSLKKTGDFVYSTDPIPSASTAPVVGFTMNSPTANIGQSVTVKVDVSANANFSAATFELNYDTTKFDYVSSAAGDALSGGLSDVNQTAGKVAETYVSSSPAAAAGTVLEVKLKIKDGCIAQNIPIDFQVTELCDENSNNISYNITSGTIQIKNYMYGDVNNNFGISSIDALQALQLSTGKLAKTEFNGIVADVNTDGKISSMDALKILQTSTGKVPALIASQTRQKTPLAQWNAKEYTFYSIYNNNTSLVTGATSDFETSSVPTGWTAFGGSGISISSTVAHSGSKSLKMTNRSASFHSPAFNIYNTMKANGAGYYKISFWVYFDSMATSPANANVLIRGGSDVDANSFIVRQNGPYYCVAQSSISTTVNTWTQYTAYVNVLDTDLTRASGTFNVMLDGIASVTGQNVYFDDFTMIKNHYASPFSDVQMDAIFTGPNNTTMTVPAFWDGGNVWKVRFAPTITGDWSFTTVNSDTTDTGLHNQTGSLTCYSYGGNLDIYKHGFLTTSSNKRYFTYADGSPFFYLGDTHWSVSYESFDSSNVAGVASQFKYMVDKRVTQGFTVFQSGLSNTKYTLADGLTDTDISGFQNLDQKFQYIAAKGMVNVNSQITFASELGYNGAKYPDSYLEKLSRYWVARYAAYPVMWTTAQEVDNDSYAENSEIPYYTTDTNPWKKVAAWVHQYDPYKQNQTAHMESVHNTTATNSSFKYMEGHNWFGAQWTPSKTAQLDFSMPMEFWYSDVTKPTVNYEGSYDHFWTNTLGARLQGWTAYLNGMYGQGYGAAGVWLTINDYATGNYAGDYDLDRDTDSEITMQVKRMSWYEGMQLTAADDLTRMKNCLTALEWWNLTPRFNDTNWFESNGAYYSLASKSNDVYVAYFYNTTLSTGTLKALANAAYTVQWYSPTAGTYSQPVTVNITNRTYAIGDKPDANDWVLIVKKA